MLRTLAFLAALCAVTYGEYLPVWSQGLVGCFWQQLRVIYPAGCPTILTKSQWGGRAATCRTAMATPVTYVIVHHTEGTACSTQSACITQAKNIQNYHMNSNGWCDIGYR